MNYQHAHRYIFSGQITPPDVSINNLKTSASIEAAGDCPKCTLIINFTNSKFTGEVLAVEPFKDSGTLLNIIEDRAQSMLDIIAFEPAIKCDCHLVSLRDDTKDINYRIDSCAPSAAEALREIKFNNADIWELFKYPKYQMHLRFSLFDARLALLYPQQSGLFCYRAIETLLKWYANVTETQDIKEHKNKAWEGFRTRYRFKREDIDDIKKIADPLRHGNYEAAIVLGAKERTALLVSTWRIIGTFIRAEAIQMRQSQQSTKENV